MSLEDSYLLVASIDFGTTYSGYAFSFRGKENDIRINKNWGDSQGFLSYKTPTSVLLNGNGEFEAFGFKAEELYLQDDEDEEYGSELGRKQLFKNFKMMLHNKKNVTTASTVCSDGNHLFPAIKIFAHALRYLKGHLIEKLASDKLTTVENHQIRWVITVPVIWSEESKQFMREAAYKAGCITSRDSKQLVIALEPEAASYFCRNLELAGFNTESNIAFPSGTRYLVLDCGGGTNDMVVHEVVLDYKVKEICAINGGPNGGNQVNEKFVSFISALLGHDFVNHFQKEEPIEWFNLLKKFERSKKAVDLRKMKIEIPYSMFQMFDSFKQGNNLVAKIKSAKGRGIDFVSGSLVLANEVVRGFFNETINNIIQGLENVFENDGIGGIDYIFMVGGFSECAFLQDAVKETCEPKGCSVLVPDEAQLAIIKGAVLYGHFQNTIVSRIARKTYGCECYHPFDSKIHPSSKRYIDGDGETKCKNIFLPFVKLGEELKVGSSVEEVYNIPARQNGCCVNIFSIDRKPKRVDFIDDSGMMKLGSIIIRNQTVESEAKRKLKIKMTFGHTEIHVEATDETTGRQMHTTVDFLSE